MPLTGIGVSVGVLLGPPGVLVGALVGVFEGVLVRVAVLEGMGVADGPPGSVCASLRSPVGDGYGRVSRERRRHRPAEGGGHGPGWRAGGTCGWCPAVESKTLQQVGATWRRPATVRCHRIHRKSTFWGPATPSEFSTRVMTTTYRSRGQSASPAEPRFGRPGPRWVSLRWRGRGGRRRRRVWQSGERSRVPRSDG